MDLNVNNNKINSMLHFNPSVVPSNSLVNNNYLMLKADSGATKTYIRESDIDIVTNIKNINTKRSVMMPNNVSAIVSHVGTLNISPNLSNIATEASILPGLKTASLLGIEGNL